MFIPIFRKDIEPIIRLIPNEATNIEEERSCVAVTLEKGTVHFKASARQTLCISYSVADVIDWTNRELVLSIIHAAEEVAKSKGFIGLEIEAPERTPLIGLLILLGYVNQFGGKRTNGMEGKYARFF
ncbi:hypothetical protein P4637_20860 [Halalkalibacterium halodurans]|jgi:hypothetical protein|uniref:BH2197 protein n=3 Tax=Halalkalibacterium halodurans TaxID=86665 RepID=Q9KAT9_HALH5|nr:hypothetical protein [Halalkalibacterium halodurans]MDY7222752.1 hypothetical protein [Halalkalibacterium halodurans]MDY7241973.1 hypothetical protein [Halalkalibacterium halodurans]MED3646962.1 hypothetical protein [Halalkalibacterium halodurans]MED4082765.1 hypothetical protein [Halalkalibacterium halodurans]MED4087265.1 hypothetical protein [Halalkalibacterium halodurans]